MEVSGQHPFQAIINELKAADVKITGSENAHRLLFKLCRFKGMQMNGSATTAARNGNVKRQKVISQARALLVEYIKTGLIVLPGHMKARGSEHHYKHDGDASANRNLWRTGWKSRAPGDNTYRGFNTAKGRAAQWLTGSA